MRIHRARLLDGARAARDVAVIVDVYRAMTTAAVLLDCGVAELRLVEDPDEALALRRVGRVDLCAGEVDGRRPPGFDHGNSPSELIGAPVRGRRVALSTRAGVAGLAAARHARVRFGAALVTLTATATVVRESQPADVWLVAMGWAGRTPTPEDEACADLLEAALTGQAVNRGAVVRRIAATEESSKFGDPARPWFPAADRDLALRLDAHPFAIEVLEDADGLYAVARRPRTAEGPP